MASSPGTLVPGEQRVLAFVADENQDLVGGPELPAEAVLWEDGEETDRRATEWVWAIEGVRGFYAATLEFPSSGNYSISLDFENGTTEPGGFQIVDTSNIPQVGESAPRSDTKTASGSTLDDISSDPKPSADFYDTSVAEAVTSGQPSVIVFATPAFCQTASCGPTLDVVKRVARDHPDVDFVHVEVFDNIDDAQGELVEVPAVAEWGLFSEPWAFVVDRDGTIAASFEGAVSAAEIDRALAGVE